MTSSPGPRVPTHPPRRIRRKRDRGQLAISHAVWTLVRSSNPPSRPAAGGRKDPHTRGDVWTTSRSWTTSPPREGGHDASSVETSTRSQPPVPGARAASATAFEIVQRELDEHTCAIEVEGELDLSTAPRLKWMLLDAMQAGYSLVVLDLSRHDLHGLDRAGRARRGQAGARHRLSGWRSSAPKATFCRSSSSPGWMVPSRSFPRSTRRSQARGNMARLSADRRRQCGAIAVGCALALTATSRSPAPTRKPAGRGAGGGHSHQGAEGSEQRGGGHEQGQGGGGHEQQGAAGGEAQARGWWRTAGRRRWAARWSTSGAGPQTQTQQRPDAVGSRGSRTAGRRPRSISRQGWRRRRRHRETRRTANRRGGGGGQQEAQAETSTPRAMNDRTQKASRRPRPRAPRTWAPPLAPPRPPPRQPRPRRRHQPLHSGRLLSRRARHNRRDADSPPQRRRAPRRHRHRSKAALEPAFPPTPIMVRGTPIAHAITPPGGAAAGSGAHGVTGHRAASSPRALAGGGACRDEGAAAGIDAGRAPGAAKPHPAPQARSSPLVTTITKIADVVPLPVRLLLGLLLSLSLALGTRSWLAALRARLLERQRGELLEDVGLLQAALLPVTPPRLGVVGTSAAYRPADGPGAGATSTTCSCSGTAGWR